MPEIISIGECLIELFSKEPIQKATTFNRSLGGDSFNILVAASRLGTKTGYITNFGDDPFEPYLRETITNENIDASSINVVQGFNSVAFIAIKEDGDREFVYYRKGSAATKIQVNDIDGAYISKAKIMHCSGIAQAISTSAKDAVLQAAKLARQNNLVVSYDPNYRHQLWSHNDAREAMLELMPYVDIFMPSLPADSVPLFNSDNPNYVIKQCHEMGVKTVILTMGEIGAIVSNGNQQYTLNPYIYDKIVDTTGAGDSFKGGVLHGLLSGKSIEESALIGNISAGITITGRGATNAMPYRKQVYEILKTLKLTSN
tara:strand:+ start:396 stop:1340 length:945 start_codon:yes stop_codon:yes gene_type:complete